MTHVAARLWWGLAALHLAVLLAWFVTVAVHGPPPGDWATFRLAAERAFGGELAGVWATDFDVVRHDRWFYPPYALWLYLPLRGLSDGAAYALCAGGQLAAAVASLILLARALALPRGHVAAAAVVFGGSAAFQYDLMLGQNGATLLLAYSAAAALLRADRPVAAGLVLAPLGLKPNFTLPPALGFVLGNRRALLGFALAGLLLLAASAPFGAQAWRDFVVAVANQSAYAGTALGGRHNVTPRGLGLAATGSPEVADAVWVLAALVGAAAAVRVTRAATDPVRPVSAAVLLTLAANPYVNAYDGVILLVPALDLLAHPHRRGRALWVALFAAWLVEARNWLWPLLGPVEPGGWSIVGVVALGWLVAWAVEPDPAS